MICIGRWWSAISIGNQSASGPRHMETLKTLSVSVCHTRSEWSENLNSILLSRPLRPRRQRNILMERVSETVCDNRRHIIIPLKLRVNNWPLKTETFAIHFEPDILRLVGLLIYLFIYLLNFNYTDLNTNWNKKINKINT